MRTLLLLALCSLRLVGAVSFDNFKDGGYSGSGGHTTTIVASGTNLGCIVVTWYRSGSTGIPTCGGNSMTKVSTMATTICSGAATVDTWAYFGSGLSAGTLAVSITATVESVLEVLTVNGASQSGQPDALAAHVTGTSAGGNGIGLPITTVANNSLVVGTFCSPVAGNVSTDNGTWIGNDGNVGFHFWRSTADVSPSGSFTLQGGSSSNGYVLEANGLSISPLPSTVTSYTSNPSVIVVGP
jgi:hypothetical protein